MFEFACLGSKTPESCSNTLLKNKQSGCRTISACIFQKFGMIYFQVFWSFGLWSLCSLLFSLRLWCWVEKYLIKAVYLNQNLVCMMKWKEKPRLEKIAECFSAEENEFFVACMHEIPFENCISTPRFLVYATRTQSIE